MAREKDTLTFSNGESARDMIVSCMREAIEKERKELWIDPEKHFTDHLALEKYMTPELVAEREENRAFVTGARKRNEIAKKAGVVVIVGSTIGFTLKALWSYIATVLGVKG